MKVKASLKNLRISPRKARLIAKSITGVKCKQALITLDFTVKKISDPVIKLLNSAIANAENNFGLDSENLLVKSILIGEGPKMKRWLPRAHGRATLILKRTSHIDLILEEIVEGKNRKSKEQIEKEKNAKNVKENSSDISEKKEDADSKEQIKKVTKVKTERKSKTTKNQDNGFLQKVFQRKTGA